MKPLTLFLAFVFGCLLASAQQKQPLSGPNPRVVAPDERPAFLIQAKGQLTGYGVFATPDQLQRGTDITISVIGAQQPEPRPVDMHLARTQVVSPFFDPAAEAAKASSARKPQSSSKWVEPAIPQGCIMPDSNGYLFINRVARPGEGETTKSDPGNPWGVRVTIKATLAEHIIKLNAIIIGPMPTAIIDGVPMVSGDQHPTAPFKLALVRRQSVVMECDGVYFLVAEGQSVTIQLPKT